MFVTILQIGHNQRVEMFSAFESDVLDTDDVKGTGLNEVLLNMLKTYDKVR